ncbi:hypothetical protein EDB89DRAFT_2063131 [Lactarius sanguifluus]|nr:hypothetical protein EDB89DRAFT_2063131 [Lactarius sanguifluus]
MYDALTCALRDIEKALPNGGDSRSGKMTSTATSNPSAQLSVVLKFYEAIANWKFDVLEALFSDDYIHKTLPATANDPPKNKTEGIEYAKSLGKLIGYTGLKYEIFQFNEAPGSIWVHSRLSGDLPDGVAFNIESIYIFTLSSGDNIQITAIQEFIDTMTKLAAELAAAASAPK